MSKQLSAMSPALLRKLNVWTTYDFYGHLELVVLALAYELRPRK